jgi:uncharacterized repeat protein (TIGR03803 family)
LYGTANNGGRWGSGIVFAMNTDGTAFTTLHDFSGVNTNSEGAYTNSDGAGPVAPLILSGSILYGTASGGGSSGNGTIFALGTDGTGFTSLYAFLSMSTNSEGIHTNADGGYPTGLTLSGNSLYGTTFSGGSSGYGTLFSLSLAGPSPKLSINRDGSGGYFITAQGAPNFVCRLQRALDLCGPWSTSAPQTASDSGVIEFHDLFTSATGSAFYRAVQQ